jgi:hypothetical protein
MVQTHEKVFTYELENIYKKGTPDRYGTVV